MHTVLEQLQTECDFICNVGITFSLQCASGCAQNSEVIIDTCVCVCVRACGCVGVGMILHSSPHALFSFHQWGRYSLRRNFIPSWSQSCVQKTLEQVSLPCHSQCVLVYSWMVNTTSFITGEVVSFQTDRHGGWCRVMHVVQADVVWPVSLWRPSIGQSCLLPFMHYASTLKPCPLHHYYNYAVGNRIICDMLKLQTSDCSLPYWSLSVM